MITLEKMSDKHSPSYSKYHIKVNGTVFMFMHEREKDKMVSPILDHISEESANIIKETIKSLDFNEQVTPKLDAKEAKEIADRAFHCYIQGKCDAIKLELSIQLDNLKKETLEKIEDAYEAFKGQPRLLELDFPF